MQGNGDQLAKWGQGGPTLPGADMRCGHGKWCIREQPTLGFPTLAELMDRYRPCKS